MNLQELYKNLDAQEADLQEHAQTVIGPAKNRVEETALNIETSRRLHMASNQEHMASINTLEQAQEAANVKRRDIHALRSKIQNIEGQIKRGAAIATVSENPMQAFAEVATGATPQGEQAELAPE